MDDATRAAMRVIEAMRGNSSDSLGLASATHTHAGGPGDASSAWPVGSVFIAVVSTSPATLLGFGTWSAFGAGRVMVGFNASDADFDTAEETGGSKTVAAAGTNSTPAFTGSSANTGLVSAGTPAGTNATVTFTPVGTNGSVTYTPVGTVAAPVFTGNALATHQHELPWQIPSTTTIRQIAIATFGTGTSRAATAVSAAGVANTTSAAVALSEAKTAGTPAGTNSAPAFTGTQGTVSAQTFTGTQGTVPAQTFTGSALGTHQHTLTATGTVSAPTFTGSVTSIVQPYITCFFWKRTA